MLKHILFVLLLFSGTYYYWMTKPVTHGPGIVAPEKPKQTSAHNIKSFNHKGFKIIPKAKINMEARVLSKKGYFFDTFSELTPVDVVFGWGPMSDEKNLENLMVRQSERSFHWEMTKPPIKQREMWRNAANMHLILSNSTIEDKVNQLREGHIVNIEGYLVNAESKKGWELKTSLSRDDIGDNASELLWVKDMTVL